MTTVVAAMLVAGLPALAAADEDARGQRQVRGAESVPGQHVPDEARGLIVKTAASDASLQRLTSAAVDDEVDVLPPQDLAGAISIVDFDEPVSLAVAAVAADEVADRVDVQWAVPNVRLHPASPPNDEFYDEQYQLWDAGSQDVIGGYSIKAPSFWDLGIGTGAVVAVLDTGILSSHPDIKNRLVPGYDMIGPDQDENGSPLPSGNKFRFYVANDGNGRDADPRDPGDWIPKGDTYCEGKKQPERIDSSWHGTHVAGIVAAQRNNRIGISGIAPDARVQPVRVLGRCGSWTSDVLAGIEWASGGTVAGVPANKTPADVLNLSLGGAFRSAEAAARMCEAFGDVFGRALQRGSVAVVAAGNEGSDASLSVPAACPHAISVGATSRAGRAAFYTNTGPSVDVSAPGGDFVVGRDGVISLTDFGVEKPKSPAYAQQMGTSMAAPAVSAAAALLMSQGIPAEDIATALRTIAAPFNLKRVSPARVKQPDGTTRNVDINCDTSRCGAGIIDLGRAPSHILTKLPTIGGYQVVGGMLDVSLEGRSTGTTGFAVQWLRDGEAIPGATGDSYRVREDDRGSRLSATVRPTAPGFESLVRKSPETERVGVAVRVTRDESIYPVYGNAFSFNVLAVGEAEDESGAVDPGLVGAAIELRRGDEVLATGTVEKRSTRLTLEPGQLGAGKHRVRAVVTTDGDTWVSPEKTFTISKVPSKVSQKVPSSVKRTQRPTLSVAVSVFGVENPTGTVTVYDGSRKIASAKLSSTGKGKRTISLPKLKKGTHKIKTVYSGTSNITGKTSSTRTVRSR